MAHSSDNSLPALALVSVLVRDYDEAIDFYTRKLHFFLKEDTVMDANKRWVVVSPEAGSGCGLLLAKAVNAAQQEAVGNQAGGRVFLFLHTDDCWRDYHRYLANGIEFTRVPTTASFGIAAVFKDLYGNLWDLVQPIANEPA